MVLTIERETEAVVPASAEESSIMFRYQELIDGGTDRKTAIKTVAKEFGMPRDQAYRLVQNIN